MIKATRDRGEPIGLPVCPTCGWHELMGHRCHPQRAEHARQLEDAVPEVPSTRLGYGGEMLVFDPDDAFTVQFSIRERGDAPFKMEDLYILHALPLEAAADLVRTLAEWRKRWPKREG